MRQSTAATAACVVTGFETPPAIIPGVLPTVAAPAVVVPMLLHFLPRGDVASVLRRGGIANDPIAALLAAFGLEFILTTRSMLRQRPSRADYPIRCSLPAGSNGWLEYRGIWKAR